MSPSRSGASDDERRAVSTAVLSIGSNLGDRLAHLQTAVDTMRPWLSAVSPIYETAPWGPIEQDDYLNAVLVVTDADATAKDWLARAQAAEQAAGRTRDVRWGPRTLDVDVIVVDDVTSDDPAITLPHPRAAERAFVLVPWLAVDSDAMLAGWPVRSIVERLDAQGVHARPDLAVI
jgi:2-amino-4-hydroxy-6-hydroxymethyldihydropteridine diphosphokinase